MAYTSRADLLIAAGESIKMQEKAGIVPVCKVKGTIDNIETVWFTVDPSRYELPLAVLEGKPVFVGDELYCITPTLIDKFYPVCGDAEILENAEKFCISPKGLSWNPPKPKTVMVELLLEDAYAWAKMKKIQCSTKIYDNLGDACRKALEESK